MRLFGPYTTGAWVIGVNFFQTDYTHFGSLVDHSPLDGMLTAKPYSAVHKRRAVDACSSRPRAFVHHGSCAGYTALKKVLLLINCCQCYLQVTTIADLLLHDRHPIHTQLCRGVGQASNNKWTETTLLHLDMLGRSGICFLQTTIGFPHAFLTTHDLQILA